MIYPCTRSRRQGGTSLVPRDPSTCAISIQPYRYQSAPIVRVHKLPRELRARHKPPATMHRAYICDSCLLARADRRVFVLHGRPPAASPNIVCTWDDARDHRVLPAIQPLVQPHALCIHRPWAASCRAGVHTSPPCSLRPESLIDQEMAESFTRWCKKCNKPKPKFAHHCSVCGSKSNDINIWGVKCTLAVIGAGGP
eukprot:1191250-Prorocentrum_minimum.AAC.1